MNASKMIVRDAINKKSIKTKIPIVFMISINPTQPKNPASRHPRQQGPQYRQLPAPLPAPAPWYGE
jgi:hypothetical protein